MLWAGLILGAFFGFAIGFLAAALCARAADGTAESPRLAETVEVDLPALRIGPLLPMPPTQLRLATHGTPFAEYPPVWGRQQLCVLRVLDGDTVEAAYLLPRRFRLAGIQAPEKHAPGGAEATDALSALVPPGAMVVGDLRGVEKYGRVLAALAAADGTDVAQMLVLSGHATPWDGHGARPG